MKCDKPAYRIFNENGKPASYEDLLKAAAKSDVVFFGELHDIPICHWLEYELALDLYKIKGKELILGAEMFESDNQLIINEYLSGKLKDKNFESEVRLWPNYKTDYKPLLKLARDSSLSFIATNIPRRYASLVNKSGFEALTELDPEASRYFPPIPIAYDAELTCYKEIVKNMGDTLSHVTENIAKAQAVKDATMAHFILKNLKEGQTFLHFNGAYHSDNFQGIVWYIQQAYPNLKILTISSIQQNEIDDLGDESKGKGNFIITIPERMTKTY
jgi:uncharacterized iron-regulated protein